MDVKIILLLLADCSENSYVCKSDKDRSFAEQAKPTNYLICSLLFCVIVKISAKTAKISQYTQCLQFICSILGRDFLPFYCQKN